MAEPPGVAERLHGLLGQDRAIRHVQSLKRGPVSDSWLLERSTDTVVLRRDRPLAAALGLDRHAEWQHLHIAWNAGLGPEPLACDTERGLLLTAYLQGHSLAREQGKGHKVDWEAHGTLLRRLHDTPAPGAMPFEPLRMARAYARLASGRQTKARLERLEALAPRLFSGATLCLCHHDAHLGNVISPDAHTPRLIDWEYAALGNPLFDLAVVCLFHQLSAADCRALCRGWGDEAVAQSGPFSLCKAFYTDLAALWTDAVAAAPE